MLTHMHQEPQKPQRVVVLGAAGFVGRCLADELTRAGIEVFTLGRREVDLDAADANDRLAALLRPEDAVVMLAALTPDRGRGIPTFMSNVAMVAALADALGRVPPAHVVYLSSDSVYPMTAGLISEATAAEPPDLYGTMHLAREMMLKSTLTSPLAILRPTLIFGAADTHNSYGPNRLRRMAHKDGKITLFGDGEEMRDHILVDDVVRLIVLTLRHRSAGTLNLATGQSVSYADLAARVAARFERPVTVQGTPRQNPITHRHFDVTALRRAFPGFRFTPLDDGLAKAHREMLEQV